MKKKYTALNYSSSELDKLEKEYYNDVLVDSFSNLYILLFLFIYFPITQSVNSIDSIIYLSNIIDIEISKYNDKSIAILYNFEMSCGDIWYTTNACGKCLNYDDIIGSEIDPEKIILNDSELYKIFIKYNIIKDAEIIEKIEGMKKYY